MLGVSTVVSPTLKMKTLKHREGETRTPGHIASILWSWYTNPGRLFCLRTDMVKSQAAKRKASRRGWSISFEIVLYFNIFMSYFSIRRVPAPL